MVKGGKALEQIGEEMIQAAGLTSRWIGRPASYLDPGSGSYLLQLLIAGALGALFALRLYWKRVKSFIARLLGRRANGDADQT